MKTKNYLFILITLFALITGCESQQQKAHRIAQFRADSTRVADSIKANSKGIWVVRNYVDEFGEKSKEKYIGGLFLGQFSNSATENSDLAVKFVIDKNDIYVQLYEYMGSNPVKHGVEYGYNIKIRTAEKDVTELTAFNSSDKLTFYNTDSKKLREILQRGGEIKFIIIEDSKYTKSSYRFTIKDASGLNNAMKELI